MPDDLAWATLDSAVDYACPGFDVRRDDVRLPDGTETDFHYVEEVETVVVLPFVAADGRDGWDGDGARDDVDSDAGGAGRETGGTGRDAGAAGGDTGRAASDADFGDDTGPAVVYIEEWRQAVGRVNRGLPAGGVDPDDADLQAAAVRELAEETGYEAESVERLCSVEPVNGIANSVHHVFVARGCTPTADRNLDFNESIRVRTTTYADLVADVRAGDVRDGRTVLAVSRYELA